MGDLRSLTRDETCTTYMGKRSLKPEKSLCDFLKLSSLFTNIHFRFLYDLIARSFFLVRHKFASLDVPQVNYPFTHSGISLLPNFGTSEWSCYKHQKKNERERAH